MLIFLNKNCQGILDGPKSLKRGAKMSASVQYHNKILIIHIPTGSSLINTILTLGEEVEGGVLLLFHLENSLD